MDANSFTYREYLALILFYTANASDGISLEENDFVEQKVGKETAEKVRQYFDETSEVEIIETIDELSDQFARGGKEKVIADMQELINVDEVDQEVEEHIIRMLKKLI